MTQVSSDGGALPLPSTLSRQALPRLSSARPASPHSFNGQMLLTLQIAFRRERLAALEAEMTAACEAAALGAGLPTRAICDRERWNRTTWHRYLAAAMRLEATYGPRLRRLRREIGQLERLKTLLPAA
ncbi:hypothetical protein [Acidiphilium sp.]|uniref:hypothetical protein n=1 Tax=Acidiphilium sp. TaxID=527 RepID=UPI00258A8A86|nr:hypothetical protein [Acidiphilium sp.]